MVIPCVELVLIYAFCRPFLKAEGPLEALKKVREHEIFQQAHLNFFWQLLENAFVLLCQESLVFIVVPLVVEMLFDFVLDGTVDHLIVIEFLQDSKKP